MKREFTTFVSNWLNLKLYELIASGNIETVKVGRCTLMIVASLEQMIKNA